MSTMNAGSQVAEFSKSTWSGRGTLEQLVQELERQKESKVDFVADARDLNVTVGEKGSLRLVPGSVQVGEWLGREGMAISPKALMQFGDRVNPEMPGRFLNALVEKRPARAAEFLTALMHDTAGRRFIRTLDGRCRAYLSDRYRVLDNYDLAFGALDTARECGGEIIECALSETHMRLKFTSRQVWDVVNEARRPDKSSWYAGGIGDQRYLAKVAARSGGELPGGPGTVHPLVTLSNSETGHGGLRVRIGILRGICFNLATIEDVAANVHLGERMEAGMFSAETQAADAKAIMLKSRDSIRAAFNPDTFRKLVAKCNAAAEDKIEAPSGAVENLVKNAGLTDAAKDSILAHFLRDHDMNRYGLAQAVARHSQEIDDSDAAADAEDIAGRLIVGRELLAAK